MATGIMAANAFIFWEPVRRGLQLCYFGSWLHLCCVQLQAAVASLAEAEVPMKRLLLLVDLARQGVADGQYIPLDRWTQVLTDLSLS